MAPGVAMAARSRVWAMSAWMLCMAAGIGVVAYVPTLTAARAGIVVALLLAASCLVISSLGVSSRARRCCGSAHAWRTGSVCCVAFAAGSGWATAYGEWLRAGLLPVALEQQTLTLTGTIEGIVERHDAEIGAASGADPPRAQAPQRTLRWRLRVDSCMHAGGSCTGAPRRVLLTAYRTALQPAGGERWQLLVRLKRPRGFANPGGFDYEAWLVAQRIGAVGYLVEGDSGHARLAAAPAWSIDRWREGVARRLDRHAALQHRDLLAGLLIGDGSGIAASTWDTFRATGTVHLFVVSGLQIAFTGGLVLWLAQLWWRGPWGRSRRRDYWLGLAPALPVAALYASLAGFGLPIQRALIMFGCVVLALAAQREVGARAWSLALLLVLLGNPLAVRDAGFWFSFGAVAVLLVCAARAREPRANGVPGMVGAVRLWWRAQLALFVAALPVVLAVIGEFTLLALPANALAVPWSTLLTMPLAFAALLFEAVMPSWAGVAWQLADLTLQVLWRYLCWLQQVGAAAIWRPPGSGVFGLCCATLCAVLFLLPRGMPGRSWAWLLLLPVGWPEIARVAPGDFRVTAIDVGQGLGVLVETAGHRLLYDTGPPFGPERSVADLAIAPLLRQRGVQMLDAVVVSHRDSDHAGGWPAIAARFDVRHVLHGEPAHAPDVPGAPSPQRCRAGMQWRWDGVDFELLHPPAGHAENGNASSCVLLVRGRGVAVLLPGDIERTTEYALYDQLPAVDILLAPHHGSRTSSTAAFVARTQPRYVVFSSGYRNRFGHPHATVVERYAQGGARLLNTADSGAIVFDVQGGQVARVERWRERLVHYWD